MRISDWSSDVCSSDLSLALGVGRIRQLLHALLYLRHPCRRKRQRRGSDDGSTSTRTTPRPLSAPAFAAHGCASAASGRSRHPASRARSEEHTSELQSLMRTSYAVFCLKQTKPQLIT